MWEGTTWGGLVDTFAHGGVRRHVNDGARRFVIIDERDSTRVTRYQLGDHLGSACVELGEGEEALSYEEYHPYGTLAVRLWSLGNEGWSRKRYRYTGQERDEESGLQYHWHRYLAPWLGRWCGADPARRGKGGGCPRGEAARWTGPRGRVDHLGPVDPEGVGGRCAPVCPMW